MGEFMSQFLFVVDVPPTPPGCTEATYSREYNTFVNDASAILKSVKTYTQIQTNAWLLPAEKTWPDLFRMSQAAEKNDLSYSIILVPDGAQILTPPYKP